MKKDQFSFLDNLIKDLNNTSKYLTEDYIFNDGEEENHIEHDMPMEDEPSHIEKDSDENMRSTSLEDQAVGRHEPIILKIRETAIDGLKKYAENPSSPIYEFFKKVFLESDKVLTSGEAVDK